MGPDTQHDIDRLNTIQHEYRDTSEIIGHIASFTSCQKEAQRLCIADTENSQRIIFIILVILSIGASQLKLIKNCTTSSELWLRLENIFQSKGPARKTTLLKSLTLQKMSEGGDVREHLHGFLDTVDKAEMDVVINPDQLAIMMLYSLPSSFENFRIAIESRDELLEPETLRTKIIEEFDARKNTGTERIVRRTCSFTRRSETNRRKIKPARKIRRRINYSNISALNIMEKGIRPQNVLPRQQMTKNLLAYPFCQRNVRLTNAKSRTASIKVCDVSIVDARRTYARTLTRSPT